MIRFTYRGPYQFFFAVAKAGYSIVLTEPTSAGIYESNAPQAFLETQGRQWITFVD